MPIQQLDTFDFNSSSIFRRKFGIEVDLSKLPGLLDFQKSSYENFLQPSYTQENRKMQGLEEIFQSIFPLVNNKNNLKIEYLRYELSQPNDTEKNCRLKGLTYSTPLCLVVRITKTSEKENEETQILEKSIFLGEMPIMLNNGTFIINGSSRIIISQLKRSPGILFHGKKSKNEKDELFAKIVPKQGSWIKIYKDLTNVLYLKIDNREKILVSTFLMAMAKKKDDESDSLPTDEGYSKEDLLKMFYQCETLQLKNIEGENFWLCPFRQDIFSGFISKKDILNSEEKVIVTANQPVNIEQLRKKKIKHLLIHESDIPEVFSTSADIVSKEGIVLLEAGHTVNLKVLKALPSHDIQSVEYLVIDNENTTEFRNTIVLEKQVDRKGALSFVARTLRFPEQGSLATIHEQFKAHFFTLKNFNFGDSGRSNINSKLGINVDKKILHLNKLDIIEGVKKLIDVFNYKEELDDIDSLKNKKVNTVGELLHEQCVAGAKKMEKIVMEKICIQDVKIKDCIEAINGKIFFYKMRKFFHVSNFCQTSDEQNPLSELMQLKRISVDNLKISSGAKRSKIRAEGMRNVHESEFGKICVVNSPEGEKVGIIKYFALHSKVCDDGILKAPYYAVKDGIVDNSNIVFLSANEEQHFIITTSNYIDNNWELKEGVLKAIKDSSFITCEKKEINYVLISPSAMVSLSTAIIPFLSTDEAFRAMVASNMMRQVVSVLGKEKPLIGTGVEDVFVRANNGIVVCAKRDGFVCSVDSKHIVIASTDCDLEDLQDYLQVYNLCKFESTNQNTLRNQTPLVRLNQFVKKGQVIADCPSTCDGELALGPNGRIAFVSGPDVYEDAMVISEKFAEKLQSVYITEFEIILRDTEFGEEQNLRSVPDVASALTSHLNEDGIAPVGTVVKGGMILVGKATPENIHTQSSGQKLINSLFKEDKEIGTEDTSFRVPEGFTGVVTDVQIVRRSGIEADETLMLNEKLALKRIEDNFQKQVKLLKNSFFNALMNNDFPQDSKQTITTNLQKSVDAQIKQLEKEKEKEKETLLRGADLQPKVLKIIKIQVTTVRKIKAGDKLCGRHGNKGVIKRVCPVEDMPYTEDGEPVEILMNALSISARMNIGQMWETHLGLACKELGKLLVKKFQQLKSNEIKMPEFREFTIKATGVDVFNSSMGKIAELVERCKDGIHMCLPPFEEISTEEIENLLELAEKNKYGNEKLYDGRTGELLGDRVCVGYQQIMKLNHMSDDKKHARADGAYSVILRQPLGGKSRNGAQRVGRMEFDCLETHGAAFNIRENCGPKSDDHKGKKALINSIVNGKVSNNFYGEPEAVNVVKQYIEAMGIGMQIQKETIQQTQQKRGAQHFSSVDKVFEEEEEESEEEEVAEEISDAV